MPAPAGVASATRTRVMTMNARIFVTKRRLKTPSDKTTSKASPAKTCVISPERGLRRCLVASIVLLTGTVLTAGQAPAPSPPQQPPTFKVRVDYVEVDVVVTDRQGKLVRDLKKEDFQVLEDGKSQAVTT